jgi:hypothetical protein
MSSQAHNLLEDLQLLVATEAHLPARRSEHSSKMHSEETKVILHSMYDGKTFVESLFDAMQVADSFLARIFFGAIVPHARTGAGGPSLAAQSGFHKLVVGFSLKADDFVNWQEDAPSVGGLDVVVVLQTDFKRFLFRRISATRSLEKPFLELSQEEVVNEVAFVGSLWSAIFPQHRAIITRTMSFAVPKGRGSALFESATLRQQAWKLKFATSKEQAFREEEAALARLKEVFGGSDSKDTLSTIGSHLMTLEDVRKRLAEKTTNVPIVLSESSEGKYILRRYSPSRPSTLDFGEPGSWRGPSRRDYVITYCHGSSPVEFHRDFFLSPTEWVAEELNLYQAVFDVQHTLAIRRSGLFKLGFGQRVYTVLLPPAVINKTASPTEGYFLIPCIILYRVPRYGTFRRTLTLTFISIPITLDSPAKLGSGSQAGRMGQVREARMNEIRALRSDLRAPIAHDGIPPTGPPVEIGGPLAKLVGVPAGTSSIPELVHRVSSYVASCVVDERKQTLTGGPTRNGESSEAETITFAASLESRIACTLLQVQWSAPLGETHAWEKWLRDGSDNCLRDNIFKLLFYEDFLSPDSGYASRRAVDLRAMLVGNTLGADMSGMTFFDPTDELKLIVYPRQREHYPDYSIIRWMAFSIYADSALSSLQGMIQRFYNDLDHQGDLGGVVETLDDMIQSFVELYDLDISLYFYRREYEKLRELLRVDRNYELLLSKFASVKDDASLREQRLFNKLLLGFTVSTVTVGILGILATMKNWPAKLLLATTIPAAIGLTLIAYLIFDPVRRFLNRFD